MFGEIVLIAKVGKFVLNAVQSYAQSDLGAAELQSIEDELTAQEADGTNGLEGAIGSMTSTLDQAREAIRKSKGG